MEFIFHTIITQFSFQMKQMKINRSRRWQGGSFVKGLTGGAAEEGAETAGESCMLGFDLGTTCSALNRDRLLKEKGREREEAANMI